MMMPVETFAPDEQRALAPYFTNLDKPVFALVNLPEVVKGALFARYSRSAKSVRRLFLDEFLEDVRHGESPMAVTSDAGSERAEQLYARVLSDYGDDSVAQLGGVHLACEGVSNILTKILERGRLMAYLEQSTRYVPYTDKLGDHWKYVVPKEVEEAGLSTQFRAIVDEAFETYARWILPVEEHFRQLVPKSPGDSNFVYRQSIRAKALDTLRGLLPAATRSNLGLYGTGQAYEALLIRMRAEPFAEAREYAAMMLAELRKVIPAFLTRVDQIERGQRWSDYIRETREDTRSIAASILSPAAQEQPEVLLTDFDPQGEEKVVAAALYAVSSLSDDQLLESVHVMNSDERAAVLRAYVGDRHNRRHKPGRAFERTSYRFDILADYGAYRDLQRHRLLTTEAQQLTPQHGYAIPAAVDDVGAGDDFRRVMERSAELFSLLASSRHPEAAAYAVCMAYRVRFYMEMNAREATHVIELRTSPQGHPAYRRICQAMHRLIKDQAGHQAIAEAMQFADYSEVELERLASERASERKRLAIS